MRAIDCMHARAWLQRRRAGIDEADRLRLEQHLEGCTECRFDAAALEALVRMVDEAPLAGVADRALERALAERPTRITTITSASRSRVSWSLASAALVALAFGIIVYATRRPPSEMEARSSEPQPERAPRDERPVPAESGRLRADKAVDLTIAHARIHAAEDTDIAWRDTTLTLHGGRVLVEVDSRADARFRVRTEHFVVEVTGTVFEVTRESVEVHRGSVRIVALDETVLHPRVVAGERWEWQSRKEAPSATETATVAAPLQEPGRAHPSETPEEPARTEKEDGKAEPIPSARDRYEAAVRIHRNEPDLALGELEKLEQEGDSWGALAMFARGRLLLTIGRHAEGRAVLEQYLQRHPGGPNAEDVRRLLSP